MGAEGTRPERVAYARPTKKSAYEIAPESKIGSLHGVYDLPLRGTPGEREVLLAGWPSATRGRGSRSGRTRVGDLSDGARRVLVKFRPWRGLDFANGEAVRGITMCRAHPPTVLAVAGEQRGVSQSEPRLRGAPATAVDVA